MNSDIEKKKAEIQRIREAIRQTDGGYIRCLKCGKPIESLIVDMPIETHLRVTMETQQNGEVWEDDGEIIGDYVFLPWCDSYIFCICGKLITSEIDHARDIIKHNSIIQKEINDLEYDLDTELDNLEDMLYEDSQKHRYG